MGIRNPRPLPPKSDREGLQTSPPPPPVRFLTNKQIECEKITRQKLQAIDQNPNLTPFEKFHQSLSQCGYAGIDAAAKHFVEMLDEKK